MFYMSSKLAAAENRVSISGGYMGRYFITLLCTTASVGLLHTHALAQETPPPAQPAETEAQTDIVVTGIRQSIETSQAIKRNSDQIIDVIVAEDIGKLPDVTASPSPARRCATSASTCRTRTADRSSPFAISI